MAVDLEKLERIARSQSKQEKKEAEFRAENRTWLRKSMNIAIAIRYALRILGLSQVDLAKQLGYTPQNLTKILSGKANLTLDTICNIEETLNISLIGVTDLRHVVPNDPTVRDSVFEMSLDSHRFSEYKSENKNEEKAEEVLISVAS